MTEPRTDIEYIITDLWREVLGISQVGVDDNFFESGGNSLLATQLVSRIQKTFMIDLPLKSLFEAPTVAMVSRILSNFETKPGQIEAIARLSRKINEMSDLEVQNRLHSGK